MTFSSSVFSQHQMLTDEELVTEYTRLKAVDKGFPNYGTYILLGSLDKELEARGIEKPSQCRPE